MLSFFIYDYEHTAYTSGLVSLLISLEGFTVKIIENIKFVASVKFHLITTKTAILHLTLYVALTTDYHNHLRDLERVNIPCDQKGY